MKKYLVLLAAMALVIAMVGGAFAAVSPTVDVNAIVAKTCTAENDGVLEFGTIMSGGSGNAVALVTAPTIYCTPGTTFAVTAASANAPGFRLTDGTNFMTYTFSFNPTITGQGFATNVGDDSAATDLNMGATIADTVYNAAPAGTYGYTITLTIAF
jgi:spore coat protein U-like protein